MRFSSSGVALTTLLSPPLDDNSSIGMQKLPAKHGQNAGSAASSRGTRSALHPLTVVAAPLLAAQVGQHDRSLTGFLTSDEPHTVQRFLTTYATKAPTRANTVRLSQLYDYFLASGRTTVLASANASRWIEIDTRISEAHGLPDIDLEILKTIGLLNLIDSAGALRASPDMVLFALTDPVRCTDESARKKLLAQLNHLVDRGFLVFREFSDEYRLWQGSDVDLRGRLDELRERCDDHAVVKLLARNLPSAVVAGRHSQLTGMLRHFITTASESDTGTISGPQIEDPADGLLIFHFGDERNLPAVTSPLPVAIGISARADTVLEAGRYLLALQELLEDATLDAVARREVTERLGQARAMLATELTEAFVPGRSGTRWQLLIPDDDAATARVLGDPLPARSLAGVVSAACEEAYPYTPRIRNEMLGRHQLTSQGAKARRELLTAMVTHPDEEYLGISGYGPERAMYSGVLGYLGLHQPMQDAAGVGAASLLPFGYAEPGPECSLHPAWRELSRTLAGATQEISLDRVFRLLLARPYGIKAGVVPVMVVAALLLHAEDVALFEEGSYQPQLMPELIERLVKAPQRFTFKAVPASTGQRRLVLDKLSQLLEVNLRARPRSAMRNPALLSVTQALLDHVRTLTPYAMRTRRISSAAVAVRDALVSARDPDALVFTALPAALGMRPIKPQAPRDEAAAEAFAVHTADALKEIQTATDDLRSETVKIIARAFRLPQDLRTLRSDLAARARGFADALLEPSLKGLIALALNDSLSDDWIDPVIIRIAGTALNDWTDEKAEHFPVQAQALADALDRVSHLYQAARLDADAHPFDAQLITLTSADGSENRTMVYVPHAARETATKFAATILDQAEGELGPDGGRILLAALTQSLIATDAPKVIDESDPPRNLKRVIQ